MASRLHLWAPWLQIAALIGGGLLITVASTLPWMDNGLFGRAGVEFVQGKITFALGGVAVLLAALRIAVRTDSTKVFVTVLGLWLSAAVIMLPIAIFFQVSAFSSDRILAFLPVEEGSGLYLTMIGGAITGAGSLFGFLPTPPVRLRWDDYYNGRREDSQAPAPPAS